MKPKTFMVIAGEPSGDILAAGLVNAVREEFRNAHAITTSDYQPLYGSFEPQFFGAGGPNMAAAGVELAFDLTSHSVIGVTDVLKKYFQLRRLFHQLLELAGRRQPDAIICVDYAGFNSRFAQAIRQRMRNHSDWFHDWRPKIIQYVSPQVWASRARRAYQLAANFDLLLSILPFEKEWYAKRVPQLRVEFVGDPIVDRLADAPSALTHGPHYSTTPSLHRSTSPDGLREAPSVLLLPGSRAKELERHLPVMLGAIESMHVTYPKLQARIVLPSESLAKQAKQIGLPTHMALQIGDLPQALAEADVAIASTGTVTRECAWLGVPTVAIYKTAWASYQIGRRIVKVKFLAMPNLLANQEIFPEFIQEAATAENIARATLKLLGDSAYRSAVISKLNQVKTMLGGPGGSRRAAREVVSLVDRV